MKKGRLTMLAIMLALVSSGYSQVALTARSSELSYGWLYGYGPQSDSGSGGALRSDLVALDTIGIQNFASGNGNYLGHLWSAGVSWDLSHSYRVFGGLNSASRIESVGLSSLTSFESGASSGINSNFPGNQLNLNFQVPTTQTFYLGGVLNQQGPLNRDAAAIYLYYDTGFGYQTVYVAGTPTSQFGAVITLQSGNYKLSASSASAAGQNEVANAGWTYVFASLGNPPVPLSSITVVEGDEFQGDLASVAADDNNFFRFFDNTETLQACVRIEFADATPLDSPAELLLSRITFAARQGLAESIGVYDFASNEYVTVDGRELPSVERPPVVTLIPTAGHTFRSPGSIYRVLMCTSPVNDEDPSQDGWLISCDYFALREL